MSDNILSKPLKSISTEVSDGKTAITTGLYRTTTKSFIWNRILFLPGFIARVWQDKGEYDKSIANPGGAIRLNSDYAQSWTNRGNVWSEKSCVGLSQRGCHPFLYSPHLKSFPAQSQGAFSNCQRILRQFSASQITEKPGEFLCESVGIFAGNMAESGVLVRGPDALDSR